MQLLHCGFQNGIVRNGHRQLTKLWSPPRCESKEHLIDKTDESVRGIDVSEQDDNGSWIEPRKRAQSAMTLVIAPANPKGSTNRSNRM
jgi:hypothetical protein